MNMKRIISTSHFGKLPSELTGLGRKPLFLIFVLLLIAGIAFGAFAGRCADEELMKRLDIIFLTDHRARCTQGMADAFIASFASAFIFLLILFLSGLSLWGSCVSAFIPFIKGYGYGLSIGCLYIKYGISGILYNLLVILPGAFLSCAVICAASQEAAISSWRFLCQFRKKLVSESANLLMKNYLMAMLWLLFLSAFSSLVDMLFSVLFSWMFSFG